MVVFFHRKIDLKNPTLLSQGILLGILFGIGTVAQTMALKTTSASIASFVTSFEVIFVPLLVCILSQRLPTISVVFAVILTMTGIACLTFSSSSGFDTDIGICWALASAFCFAVFVILTGKFSKSGKPLIITCIQSLTLFLISGLYNLSRMHFIVPDHANQWIAILFCGILSSVLSAYLLVRYQRFVSATKAALIVASEPVFATITAILYLNERITTSFIIGACLIFSGILISEFKPKARTVSQADKSISPVTLSQ